MDRLDGVLRRRAADLGDAPILIDRRKRGQPDVSWRELDRRADGTAGALERRFGRGQRIALVMRDEVACHAAVYGVFRTDNVLVPIDPAWGRHAISSMLEHAGVAGVVGPSGALDILGLPSALRDRFLAWPEQPEGPERPVEPAGTGDDIALLAFTSGTTSDPKGITLRHRHLRSAYDAGRRAMALDGRARWGCAFRLSGLGILGMNYLLAREVGAATVVLPELTLASARTFWRGVQESGVDFVYLVPPLVQLLNRLGAPVDWRDRPPLCVTAAAPIAESTLLQFQERFGVTLLNAYGLTEASFAVFFGHRDATGRATGSIGRAETIDARLIDAAGRVVDGPGEGELELSGPTVSDGYWNNPEATARVFDGTWLKTGDWARREADGTYTIQGRTKEVAIHGGFTIHLAEVDEVLSLHPSVIAACAVDIPSTVAGDDLAALVQCRSGDGCTEQQLLSWCREQLGATRAPRRIIVTTDPIGLSGAGKIQRRRVRERVMTELSSL